MLTSKLLAQRFAVDLSSMALGMWEAGQLLSEESTKAEGIEKLNWLRDSLAKYQKKAVLGDSLRVHLRQDFKPHEYIELLNRLESGNIRDAMGDIEALINKTQEYVNEARRTKTSFKSTLRYY